VTNVELLEKLTGLVLGSRDVSEKPRSSVIVKIPREHHTWNNMLIPKHAKETLGIN
jgi:hypothetical protein